MSHTANSRGDIAIENPFTRQERLELLKIELQSLQGILDKYDDLVYRQRNWFITLWMGCTGVALSVKSTPVMLLGIILALLYFVLEGMIRYQTWFKYVVRYRTIRDTLNSGKGIEDLSLYDLTNHYMDGHATSHMRLRKSFIKWDAIVLYFSLATGSFVMWWIMNNTSLSDFKFPIW